MSAALPAKPSLEQLKNQAKDLLSAHADRNPTCLPVLRHLHRFKDSTEQSVFSAELKLADVQFALAMEYGFTTWEELVRHLETLNPGLGARAADAWTRLRKSGALDRIIGGEAKSVTDGSWGIFTYLHVEGPEGRFTVEETEPGERTDRLLRQQRLGDFLIAAGIQAPRITMFEVEGKTYGVHRALEGVPVGSVELSAAELETYAQDLARILGRMHAVPFADALRILGMPAMTAEEAARTGRFGGYLDVDVMEAALARELDADGALLALWRETRTWITTFVSTPADLVFGHGNMWSDSPLLTRTPEGYRLSGIYGLYNAGLGNLYDEFLRVASLGYFSEDKPVERAVLEAYHRLPGTRRVDDTTLRHAITAFWFYLAHEQSGQDRADRLASAKKNNRWG